MRAAQQGHEPALILLSECYKDNRGINDTNECDVRSCINMKPGERAARKAARELFSCLSNGEQYITASQLERRMREIYQIQKKRRKRDSDSDEDNEIEMHNGLASPTNRVPRIDHQNQELLTEANLVQAAVQYSNGHLPPVSRALILSSPDPQSLQHIPYFHRPLFHPIMFFTILYHRFIQMMTSFPEIALSNFYFIILLFIYTMVASENLGMFIPVGIYYFSFIVMIVASFKMLKSKHEFIDFRIWSGLFLRYGDENLGTENSENQYLRNNLKPYLYYFAGFAINVMLQPVISNQLIPHSEITVISFILIFITMIAFMYSTTSNPLPDYLILFSFAVNVLAKYPYEDDTVVTTGWRFLDLKVPNFSSFVIGNGIEFCLNCRGLLYFMIPGSMIYLAKRGNWKGTYQYLIPHCVTLSWLQICILSSQSATIFGMMRTTLGLAGLLLFLPLFGIVTLLIPVFAAIEWFSLTDPTVRLIVSIIAAVLALIGSAVMAANHRTEKYVTFLQVAACVVATVFLTLPYMSSNFDETHSSLNSYESLVKHKTKSDENLNLKWEMYHKYCHQWDHVNKIQTQLRCSHLDRTPIRWDGFVTDVEIVKIYNYRSDFMNNYFPIFLRNFFMCFYGEKNKELCTKNEQCDDIRLFMDNQNRCNLDKWNSYDYEITVRMDSGILSKTEVVLKAQNTFGNFTQHLTASDKIWFRGYLRNFNDKIRLGRTRPIVELKSVGCLNCKIKNMESVFSPEGLKLNSRIQDLMRGVKYLLNVLFNPLLTFK